MNPGIVGAAVHMARNLRRKPCPKCGEPLERQFFLWRQVYVWAHRLPVDGYATPECAYSEPEQAGKEKR